MALLPPVHRSHDNTFQTARLAGMARPDPGDKTGVPRCPGYDRHGRVGGQSHCRPAGRREVMGAFERRTGIRRLSFANGRGPRALLRCPGGNKSGEAEMGSAHWWRSPWRFSVVSGISVLFSTPLSAIEL